MSNAGVPTKIIKECTGHRSDAVNKYQVTSTSQKEAFSKIVSGKHLPSATVSAPPDTSFVNVTSSISNTTNDKKVASGDGCKQCGQNNMGNIVSDILKCVSESGKAKIKIEIEVSRV